ncbi:hypothetical protein [Zobellia sp. B3R18]|nr:hypothetical protein [Zobellia sp. B3R18]
MRRIPFYIDIKKKKDFLQTPILGTEQETLVYSISLYNLVPYALV